MTAAKKKTKRKTKAKRKTTTKKKTTSKRKKSMEAAVEELAKEYDIQVMDESSEDRVPYFVPFRHIGLQSITGGIPGGKMTMIEGDSQCGKSYLLYEIIHECLNMGGHALLDDPENAFETRFGKRVGIIGPGQKFSYSTERRLPRIFKMWRKWVLAIRAIDPVCPIVIGCDSYPATVVKLMEDELNSLKGDEIKGYMSARKNAQLAELLSEFCGFIAEHKVAFIMINQLRKKMNVMFGDPTTVNAEEIFKYYVNLRIRGRLGSKIKEKVPKREERKARQIGVKSTWETIKNRNIDPFKKVETEIIYKTGVDSYSGLLELLQQERKVKASKERGKYIYNKKRFSEDRLPMIVKKYPDVLDLVM